MHRCRVSCLQSTRTERLSQTSNTQDSPAHMPDHHPDESCTSAKGSCTQEARSGIVYRIPCKDCNSSYVGQSRRSLAARLKEHQRAVFTGNSNLSALAEHTMNTDHEVDWPSAMVLDSCQAFYQRSYLESWYIHKEQAPSTESVDHSRLSTRFC